MNNPLMLKKGIALAGGNLSLPAPAVTRTIPRAGQAGVFPDTDIMVTFNQAIQEGAGFADISVTDVTGQSVNATYSVWGDTLTIKPANTLAYDTQYTVTLPIGSIDGAGGNALTAGYTFSFTTKFAVTGTNPADQAAGVSINTPVTIAFSNIVKEGPNFSRISLYPADDPGAPVTLTYIQLSGMDNNTRTQMTLTYQGILAPAADYRVTIPAGAVLDEAGHRMDADYSFDFQTQQTLTLPQVYFSAPAGGAKGVNVNQAISLTFNHDIVAGPNYNGVAVTVYQSGTPVAVGKEIVSDQLIITPAAPLSYTTTYAVSIPAGAVADAVYGNMITILAN